MDKPETRCALIITTFISLNPNSIDPPITNGDKEEVRVKVVDGMKEDTVEGGVIYNALACPLNTIGSSKIVSTDYRSKIPSSISGPVMSASSIHIETESPSAQSTLS